MFNRPLHAVDGMRGDLLRDLLWMLGRMVHRSIPVKNKMVDNITFHEILKSLFFAL